MRETAVTHDPLRHLLLCTLIQTEEEVLAATLGFHIRHIAESVDRFLTYAEKRSLAGLSHQRARNSPKLLYW